MMVDRFVEATCYQIIDLLENIHVHPSKLCESTFQVSLHCDDQEHPLPLQFRRGDLLGEAPFP